jgi:hypothetical protein
LLDAWKAMRKMRLLEVLFEKCEANKLDVTLHKTLFINTP